MRYSLSVWAVGILTLLATTANEVLNGILAFGIVGNSNMTLALRILFLVAFGLTIVGVVSLTYFIALFQYKVNRQRSPAKHYLWAIYAMGIAVASIGLAVSGVAVIWAIIERHNLPQMILYRSPQLWLFIWTGFWATSTLSQLTFFLTLGLRIRSLLREQTDAHAGPRSRMDNRKSLRVDTSRGRSLTSCETTPASFPRSPSTNATSSLRGPLTGNFLRAINSRTKLIGKNSARSSFDHPSPKVGETLRMDAFEQWDTSAVHHEMRAAVGPSPVASKPAIVLDPIPGSRPTSSKHLDHSFETFSSSPRMTPSEQSTSHEMSSPISHHPSSHTIPSSPPSSPPNFSRPTSKSKIRLFASSIDVAREEHVHPLFRSTSPHPPPLATMGTTVTVADPNSPITPKSLARLRDSSLQERGLRHVASFSKKSHWRAMPSIDAPSTRPSTAGSNGPGSPGPSIADEEELPPILPGFVLGAGSRSSLIGYSSRKSSKKDKRASLLSYAE